MKKAIILMATMVTGLVMYGFNPLPVYSAACFYEVTPSPTSVPFADTIVGNSSAATTVTITNSGNCDLTSLSASLSGDSGEFSIGTNTCTGGLSHGASCQVDITFEPSAAGNSSAALSLSTGEVNFPDLVALSGTGIAAPADSTALLAVAALQSQDDSDGCNAIASTGAAGQRGFGPAALGLVAMLGLVMATAAVRRRKR